MLILTEGLWISRKQNTLIKDLLWGCESNILLGETRPALCSNKTRILNRKPMTLLKHAWDSNPDAVLGYSTALKPYIYVPLLLFFLYCICMVGGRVWGGVQQGGYEIFCLVSWGSGSESVNSTSVGQSSALCLGGLPPSGEGAAGPTPPVCLCQWAPGHGACSWQQGGVGLCPRDLWGKAGVTVSLGGELLAGPRKSEIQVH